MAIKCWVIRLTLGVFILGVCAPAHAEVLSTSIVDFDKATLVRGYTVVSADKQLSVPISRKQFKDRLIVKISQLSNETALPPEKVTVSRFYNIDLKAASKIDSKSPVTLFFNLSAINLDKKPTVYFYDGTKYIWRELASSIDRARNRIVAKIPFPYLTAVVLADGDQSAGVENIVEDALTAESAMVIDTNSHGIVFQKNVDEVRPLASLTKLGAILTFLDNNPGWDKTVKMEKGDFVSGATLWVKVGDEISVKDLFYATLVGSKNNTTKALIRSTGLTEKEFVDLMNEKMKSLGLKKTHFVEPTGLNENNVSTAAEFVKIAQAAFADIDVLKATTTKWYQIQPKNNKLTYWVKNTSEKMLNRDLYITGTKTGWTDEAGYCLVTQAKSGSRQLIALVMGAKITKNYEEVYNLLKDYL